MTTCAKIKHRRRSDSTKSALLRNFVIEIARDEVCPELSPSRPQLGAGPVGVFLILVRTQRILLHFNASPAARTIAQSCVQAAVSPDAALCRRNAIVGTPQATPPPPRQGRRHPAGPPAEQE